MSIESAQNNNANNPEKWTIAPTIKSSNDQRSDVEILAKRIEKIEQGKVNLVRYEVLNELLERIGTLESENSHHCEAITVLERKLETLEDKIATELEIINGRDPEIQKCFNRLF